MAASDRMIDCAIYSDETELLELRVRTLEHVVDLFIIVTCSLTHQGEPAPLTTLPPLPVDNVLLYRVVVDRPQAVGDRGGVGSPHYQKIEQMHRDGIAAAVHWAGITDPTALVMISDVDEIPDARAVADRLGLLDRMGSACRWLVFSQRFHSTSLDLLHPQQPWLGTTISRASDLKPQAMRDARGELAERGCVIERGGVHLSWMGTDAERQRKLETFSHAELRGRWDPAEGRRTRHHANGEVLRKLSMAEIERLEWPRPLRDGSFSPPAHWWSDA